MRKSTMLLAFAGSAALVIATATTSIATTHGANNIGHSVAMKQTVHYGSGHVDSAKNFHAYATPKKKYTKNSCDIDLSAIADDTSLSSVKGCKTKVTLSGTWIKLSVPNSWSSWNSPPAVESATPNVLYSDGQDTATVSFGKMVKTGGFEVEPDAFQVDTIEVDFYTGANGTGTMVGSITLSPNGQSGALLYGAHSSTPFKSAVITDQNSDDFAIAQVRV